MKEEFWRIIEKLTSCYNAKIIKNKDETDFYFSIMNSCEDNYWISLSKDYDEIIIGFNSTHIHFGIQYGENYEMENSIDFLKKNLISEIIITTHFAGNKVYKTEHKITYESEVDNIGSGSVLLYKFWKKKKLKLD